MTTPVPPPGHQQPYPPLPPQGNPSNPAGYPPPPPGYQPQQPAGYPSQPPPQPMKTVSKTGLSAMGTTVHIILTIFTCGCWGVVWFFHWLFTRQKTTTYHQPM